VLTVRLELYSSDVVCLCVHVCIAALCWGCLASGTNSSAVNCVSGYSCPSVTGPYWAYRYRLLQPSLPVEWASRTFSVSLPPLLLEPISPVSFPPEHFHSVLLLMLSYTSMIGLVWQMQISGDILKLLLHICFWTLKHKNYLYWYQSKKKKKRIWYTHVYMYFFYSLINRKFKRMTFIWNCFFFFNNVKVFLLLPMNLMQQTFLIILKKVKIPPQNLNNLGQHQKDWNWEAASQHNTAWPGGV